MALEAALRGWQAKIWTTLPGIIQSFDAAKLTAVVQPSVQAQVRDPAGNYSNVTLPQLLDCPVIFPAGGGCALTFPLAKGDEVLVIFASRCIDAWWQSGGVQPQAEIRAHDLSDGFCIPGCFSQPRVLANVSTTTAQLRSDDGAVGIELDPAGHIVNIVAPGGINIIGPVHVTGDLAITGSITGSGGSGTEMVIAGDIRATGNVTAGHGTADQVALQTHRHPGNNTPPTPGT